jgi:chromosomal replication initiation ATPase DnaA
MPQEVFDFYRLQSLDWRDFVEGDENHEALVHLTQWPNWSHHGTILYGDPGVGKTHLAALWAQTVNAVYVLAEGLRHNPRSLFDANCNFLLDNFDDLLEIDGRHLDWLFHFFNIAHEKDRFFLILARTPPTSWRIGLKDLRSRLLAIPTVKMKTPGDELLFKIAKKIANDLGLTIGDNIISYILGLVTRDVSSIANVLKMLDKLSLQEKKPITSTLVRRYLCGDPHQSYK